MRPRSRSGAGRGVLAVVLVLLVAGSGLALYYVFSPPSNDVALMLNFLPSPYHAPIYYGQADGVYGQNGIKLSIQPAQNDGESIAEVSAGKVQFGLTDTSNLVQAMANSNITNVRIIAILFQKTLYSVIYNQANISSVSDLQGKVAGAVSPDNGGIITPLFNIMAEANGVDLSSIHWEYSSAVIHNALLTTGKVDFILSVASNLPALQATAAEDGIHLGEFNYADYGVDGYGLALITSTQMISQHRDLVSRFVLSTMQSLQDAMASPSAAAAAMVAEQPQLNVTQVLVGLQIDLKCCSESTSGMSSPLQLGWINAGLMQQTVETDMSGLNITAAINPSVLYTNEFVMQP